MIVIARDLRGLLRKPSIVDLLQGVVEGNLSAEDQLVEAITKTIRDVTVAGVVIARSTWTCPHCATAVLIEWATCQMCGYEQPVGLVDAAVADQLAGAVATAADAISLAEHLIPYAPQHERARFFAETAELRKLSPLGGNRT